jgi:O-succinylbenzoic acid--CoA ligase
LLIRTSGSSGEPRVVMLTREQLLASAERVNRALGLGAGDQWLCPLPLHHIGGMAIAWRCALAGSTMRLLCPLGSDCGAPLDKRTSTGSGFDADLVARTLASYPVTHLSLVPPMLQRLLDVMPRPPDALRVLLLGGQALHPALARRAADAGWPLFVSYGMSETGSMVAVGRWRDDSTPGTRIGPLLPDVDIASPPPSAAAAHRGGGVGAGLGADLGADLGTGPLRLRGPMLMAGYGNPRRRPGVGLEAGWLDTADLGRLDADGALRIFGRADEVLVIGGEQVHPAAVEARLAEAPGIGEVAVLGVPHPTWGATLAACWSGPISARELERWCRDRLPSRQRPRVLRRIEALPRLASGKLDRAALQRAATAAGEDVVGF